MIPQNINEHLTATEKTLINSCIYGYRVCCKASICGYDLLKISVYSNKTGESSREFWIEPKGTDILSKLKIFYLKLKVLLLKGFYPGWEN